MVRAMDMLARARTISINDFGFTPPAINIWWNPCTVVSKAWPRFLSIRETNFIAELASNIFGQRIELHQEFATSESWFFCTIAHEFGHFLQCKMYGNYLPNGIGPDPHYIYSESSPEFAFIEGWAIFFADYVLNRNGFIGEFNLENFCVNYGITTRPTEQEGRVAGFFWDVVDNTPQELGDQVAEATQRIAELFINNKPKSISDFASNWQAKYGSSLNELFTMTFERQMVGAEYRDYVVRGRELILYNVDDGMFPVILAKDNVGDNVYTGNIQIEWGDNSNTITASDVTKSCRINQACTWQEFRHSYSAPDKYPLRILYEQRQSGRLVWVQQSIHEIEIKPDISPILNLLLGD